MKAPDWKAAHIDKIILSLRNHGPQTIHELATTTGLDAVQVARRMPEIKGPDQYAGVARNGQRRDSPSGHPCAVWAFIGRSA